MRASIYRRILCLLVCLVLLVGVSPALTLAEGDGRTRQTVRVGIVEQDGYAMRDSADMGSPWAPVAMRMSSESGMSGTPV